ncbi:L,D-transpeptidase [Methylobacterium sp. NEAU 140]|uniref:L,D-transpeptidase n=1 Tax=Methylobacterium sp. NEAU 140 TaxID=3064945 RepID=UPI0027369297|nr:L,D-transpeptidase [Methylobacterium sp. NEAU 140]MDP4021332.1 L,D-transpeptidase [Methylobacterium sp. NEAU 140]
MRGGAFRVGLGGAALAVALCGPAAAQGARYAEGGYGGGLIEYLVTGGAGGRGAPARAAPAPQRVAVYSGDPVPAYGEPANAAVPSYGYGTQVYGAQGYGAQGYGASGYGAPAEADPSRIARAVDPQYRRQEVDFPGSQRPGTIVVDTGSKHLYLVQPGHRALRYGIGVGRPGFTWSGLKTVSRKAEWPDWTPPPEMLARRPDLPRHMEGGPGNPLGARALYLGSSLYRIHGTNEPHTIGQNVSSGCIRMMNEDVTDLYDRVPVGTRVEVL